MSRTIRRLPDGSNRNCLKWYSGGRFGPEARAALKAGKPPHPGPDRIRVQNTREYEYQDTRYVEFDSHTDMINAFGDRRVIIDWRHIGDPEEDDSRRKVRAKIKVGPPQMRTSTYWKREWNPAYDSEVADRYYEWLNAHAHVYRNETCRRQRIHGTALTKRIHARSKRHALKNKLRAEMRNEELEDVYSVFDNRDLLR